MNNDNPVVTYLKDYRPPDYFIDRVDLTFYLHETQCQVDAHLWLRANQQQQDLPKTLALDGENLILHSLKREGQLLVQDKDYALEDGNLIIQQPSKEFDLEIKTEINPKANTALQGLYCSKQLFCTQCEANGFRKITFYLDRPDVLAKFRTTIIADKQKYPVLLSNGDCVERLDLKDGMHQVSWVDPFPKPAYLFALVAGNLTKIQDSFTTKSARKVDLQIYVEHENEHKCEHAIASLKKAMAWDERVYQLEYDLSTYMIVAVSDFNMGAMENKGLNIFNDKYVLADKKTATDDDYFNIEKVIAHEYFHNWTGNRVTLRDWFQLSLKEGLTVFRDQNFSADMASKGVCRIEDAQDIRTLQFAEDQGPMAHPVRPDSYIEMNNFYTVTVYNKGAEVIRMLYILLGHDGFHSGMALYIKRFDGKAVTTEDFIQTMEDANSVDLKQFRLWYTQAGTPQVDVIWAYDKAQCSYTLTVSQKLCVKASAASAHVFHIPLVIGLLGKDGQPLALEEKDSKARAFSADSSIIELRQVQEQFTFVGVEQRPCVSLFRHFSAPVKVNAAYTTDELTFLLAHDTDDFNRWDAGQKLIMGVCHSIIAHYKNGKAYRIEQSFIEALKKVLLDTKCDKAIRAQILTLPSEMYIGQTCEAAVDVEAVAYAYDYLKQHIASTLRDELLDMYHSCVVVGDYQYCAADAASRRLQDVCLSYLAALYPVESEHLKLCLQKVLQGDNMTETISALRNIVHYRCAYRDEAVRAFYEQYKQVPLVINKWFALQAQGRAEDTLNLVIQLANHPEFDINNPNKVYALLLTFSRSNQRYFHTLDGTGYHFIADCVLALNQRNPQIAARLVSAFLDWKRFAQPRAMLLKKELERLLGGPKLSKDVYEIVARALQES